MSESMLFALRLSLDHAISLVMPSSEKRKCLFGSSKGELMTGFSMTTCFIHPYPMFVWWVQRAGPYPYDCPLVQRKICNKTGEKGQGEGENPLIKML